uniref:Uncharacterized protein n=1 Tax=Cyprinus carpio TaxID=7962 RepID=A0A8C1VXH7_CYPCA
MSYALLKKKKKKRLFLFDKCVGNSCYPNLGELMASSTCGLYRPQNYCILGYLEVSCHKCNTSRGPNVNKF